MVRYLYVLTIYPEGIYEEEITEEEYNEKQGYELIKKLDYDPDNCYWLFSDRKLKLISNYIEDRT